MENLLFNLFLFIFALAAIYLIIITVSSFAKILKAVIEGAILIVALLLVFYFFTGYLGGEDSYEQPAPEYYEEPVPERETPGAREQAPAAEDLEVYQASDQQRTDRRKRRVNVKPGAVNQRQRLDSPRRQQPDTIVQNGRRYRLIPAEEWKGAEPPRFGFTMTIDEQLYYAVPKVDPNAEPNAPYLRRKRR